ncbi:MAG: hypothetical protein H7196_04205 [candidate division SR1 bacterium]|nr:hypothetical protein [candidate division SR1 bacterium]
MEILDDEIVLIPALTSEETEKLHLYKNAKGCIFEPDYNYLYDDPKYYAQNKRVGDPNPRHDDWDASYDENGECLHPVNIITNYIDWSYIEE